MEVINNQPDAERIEKQGKIKIMGISEAKTFKKALETLIGIQVKKGNIELEKYTQGLLQLYNKYHPEVSQEVDANQWQGHSSINLSANLKELTIIKYQKKTKNNEPTEVKTIVPKEELGYLIRAINYLYSDKKDSIDSKDIALQFCVIAGIRYDNKGRYLFSKDTEFWTLFFNWRKMHNRLCTTLNAFEELGMIEYNAGQVKLIKNPLSIGHVLP